MALHLACLLSLNSVLSFVLLSVSVVFSHPACVLSCCQSEWSCHTLPAYCPVVLSGVFTSCLPIDLQLFCTVTELNLPIVLLSVWVVFSHLAFLPIVLLSVWVVFHPLSAYCPVASMSGFFTPCLPAYCPVVSLSGVFISACLLSCCQSEWCFHTLLAIVLLCWVVFSHPAYCSAVSLSSVSHLAYLLSFCQFQSFPTLPAYCPIVSLSGVFTPCLPIALLCWVVFSHPVCLLPCCVEWCFHTLSAYCSAVSLSSLSRPAYLLSFCQSQGFHTLPPCCPIVSLSSLFSPYLTQRYQHAAASWTVSELQAECETLFRLTTGQ